MPNSPRVHSLIEKYKAWDGLPFEKYYRKELGTVSLFDQKEIVLELKSWLELFIEHGDQLSDQSLQQVNQAYGSFSGLIENVARQNDGSYVNQRQSHITQLNNVRQQILPHWNQLAGIISYQRSSPKDSKLYKSLQEELQKSKEQSEYIAKELTERKAASLEDAEKIEQLKNRLEKELKTFEDRYKTLLSSGEFLKQEEIFKNSAKEHDKLAKLWLIGIIASSLLLTVVVVYIFKHFCFELECFTNSTIDSHSKVLSQRSMQILWYELIKAIIFRVFIISIAVYSLMFSIKNYNAHMHNKTINTHKENSFAAALSLINRAQTPEGKDQLITQAALSIFSHQKTGYIGKEYEPNNPFIIDKLIDKIK